VTRPTREDVGHTTDLVWHLASADDKVYPDVAMVIDLLVWLDGEIIAARQAAAYGNGTSDIRVLGSSPGGVENRLNDPLLNDLRGMRSRWRAQLATLVVGWQHDAHQAANWPYRTAEST
jgi:hypothetical protein